MNYQELQAFLALMMVSDPWPLSDVEHAVLEQYADESAKERGYANWIEAYHSM